MARAGHPKADVLSRVRREQRLRGKSSGFFGVRIVLAATGITLAILLFAFGAVGMLMMARSPQEPVASKLDTPPFVAPPAQAQTPPVPETPALELALPAPQQLPPPTQNQLEAEIALQQPAPQVEPEKEPETTASLPAQPEEAEQTEEPAPKAQRNVRPRPRPQYRQQQVQRRPVQQKKSEEQSPLMQLFGIKQYR